MADIGDVQQELENLNLTMDSLLSLQQRQILIQQGGPGGGPGGGPAGGASFMAGVVKGALLEPFKFARDFWKNSLKIATRMVESVDSLEFSNLADGRDTRALIAQTEAQAGFQRGGFLDNVEMQLTALEAGVDLAGQDGKRLKNQLTMLDKAGAQGKMLLNYTKDLVAQGFKRADINSMLQTLTDIGFYSIQTANSQTAMAKKLTEGIAIEELLGGSAGKDIQNLMNVMVHDAPDSMKLAFGEVMKTLLLPENMEEIIIKGMLGGDKTLSEIKEISRRLSSAMVQANSLDKDESAAGQLAVMRESNLAAKLLVEYAERSKEHTRMFVGAGGDEATLAKRNNLLNEQIRTLPTMNALLAGWERHLDLQTQRKESDTASQRGVSLAEGGNFLNAFGMYKSGSEMAQVPLENNLLRIGEELAQVGMENLVDTSQMIKEYITGAMGPMMAGLTTGTEYGLNMATAITSMVMEIPGMLQLGETIEGWNGRIGASTEEVDKFTTNLEKLRIEQSRHKGSDLDWQWKAEAIFKGVVIWKVWHSIFK
jgi:hypothetical protein